MNSGINIKVEASIEKKELIIFLGNMFMTQMVNLYFH